MPTDFPEYSKLERALPYGSMTLAGSVALFVGTNHTKDSLPEIT